MSREKLFAESLDVVGSVTWSQFESISTSFGKKPSETEFGLNEKFKLKLCCTTPICIDIDRKGKSRACPASDATLFANAVPGVAYTSTTRKVVKYCFDAIS